MRVTFERQKNADQHGDGYYRGDLLKQCHKLSNKEARTHSKSNWGKNQAGSGYKGNQGHKPRDWPRACATFPTVWGLMRWLQASTLQISTFVCFTSRSACPMIVIREEFKDRHNKRC